MLSGDEAVKSPEPVKPRECAFLLVRRFFSDGLRGLYW